MHFQKYVKGLSIVPKKVKDLFASVEVITQNITDNNKKSKTIRTANSCLRTGDESKPKGHLIELKPVPNTLTSIWQKNKLILYSLSKYSIVANGESRRVWKFENNV